MLLNVGMVEDLFESLYLFSRHGCYCWEPECSAINRRVYAQKLKGWHLGVCVWKPKREFWVILAW